MPEFNGTPRGQGRRFAVVVSRFNETVTQRLVEGALDALVRHGVAFDDIDVLWVPGAWELPLAARRAAATERYDAIVALGAVIRGDTPTSIMWPVRHHAASRVRASSTTCRWGSAS